MARNSSDTSRNAKRDISSHFNNKKIHIILACIAVVAIAGLAFAAFNQQMFPSQKTSLDATLNASTFYKGIQVQGIDLGGKSMAEAQTAIKALEPSLRDKYDITITYGDKNWKITEDDFTFTFNTDQVLKDAYDYARTGTKEERSKLINELASHPKNFEITHTMTYDNLKTKISSITKSITVAPVDATVASFDSNTGTFTYKDGKDGLTANENKLYEDVVKVINGSKTGTVAIQTTKVPFNVTAAQVKSHMQKLGTFSTYSTNGANGNHNMRLALSKVNGTCVAPGAVFSFNGTVGDSTTAESGFLKAGAIAGGKTIQEYGGGICQASTTIYGAALRSNMEVVSRSNHLWPSSYVPIGLDATISYPYLDMKFRNPTQYPIYIVAGMDGTKLTVTFYGYQSPDYDEIRISSWRTETTPMPDAVYKTDNSLKKGEKKLDTYGKIGQRAAAQRVLYKNGVAVKTEALPSSYYSPVAPVYLVGQSSSIPASSSSPSKTPSISSHASSTPSSSSNSSSKVLSSSFSSSHS